MQRVINSLSHLAFASALSFAINPLPASPPILIMAWMAGDDVRSSSDHKHGPPETAGIQLGFHSHAACGTQMPCAEELSHVPFL